MINRYLVCLCFFLSLPNTACAVLVVDQSPDPFGQSGLNRIRANDFQLPSAVTLQNASVSVWLTDLGTDDGVFENMATGFSWAILADAGGEPASGDAAVFEVGFVPTAVGVDVGIAFGGDMFRFDFSLSGDLPTAPGTYWIALMENSWKSAADGTQVSWVHSADSVGDGQAQDLDPTSVGPWFTSSFENAIQINAIPEPNLFLVYCAATLAITSQRRRALIS